MNKKLILEIKINNYLSDILGYAESTYDYLTNWDYELDRDEIIMYLSTIPETIKYVRELIYELEQEYENEKLQ